MVASGKIQGVGNRIYIRVQGISYTGKKFITSSDYMAGFTLLQALRVS